MKLLVLLSLSLFMAGCASVETVMSSPVVETFHTSKTPNNVSFCLANTFQTAPLDQDDGSKVIVVHNPLGVTMAFTIYPEGSGSRIERRKQRDTIGVNWRKCIEPDEATSPEN